MPKTRKNVDENFKIAAVERLQTGGVPANDFANELGVSIWSLRSGPENIVGEQRQERAQHANALPRLKNCRQSQAVKHQSRRRLSRAD
jgi:transposase-like protein